MSYFQLSHPKQECSECRSCPASSYHRQKCAAEMHRQDDRMFEDYMIEKELFEQHMDNSSTQTVKKEEET